MDTSAAFARVLEEYNGGSLSARYDYGDDLLRMDRTLPAVSTSYYLYDGLGSTRQLVNASGTVTDGYLYDAYGVGLLHSPNSGIVNSFLFQGQQFDAASNDYYQRARYYDPTTGRFLSQDPFSGNKENPLTLHRYLYAGADPVNRVDPGGQDDDLAGLQVGLGISGVLAGIGSGVLYGIHGGNLTDAIVYGGEISVSLLYSAIESPEAFGETLISALLGGGGAIVLDEGAELLRGGLNNLSQKSLSSDFTDKLFRDFIQGAATGSIAGAFSGGTQKIALAILTGGDTAINDAIGIYDDYERGEITTPKQFGYKIAGLAFDTIFSVGVATLLDSPFFKGPIAQDEANIIIKHLQGLNGTQKKLFKTLFEDSIASFAGVLVGQGPKRLTDQGAESP